MEIKIGLAKINKQGEEYSGDSLELAERPHGGVTAIVATGQGNSQAAHNSSSVAVNKAAAMIAEGARDSAIADAVHDCLYEMPGRKGYCTLTMIGADAATEMLVISRNTSCPVIVAAEEYEIIYDEEVSPLGRERRTKPALYELPFAPGLLVVTYTDGLAQAGRKKNGHGVDLEQILKIIRGNSAADAAFVAKSILEYALDLENEIPSADMAVAVLGLAEAESAGAKPAVLEAAYPI